LIRMLMIRHGASQPTQPATDSDEAFESTEAFESAEAT
jgi:hypothetical protein